MRKMSCDTHGMALAVRPPMIRYALLSALSLAIVGCGSAPADEENSDFTPASGDAGDTATAPLESGTPEPTDAATSEDAASPTDAGGLAVGCAFRATTNVNLREGPSTRMAVSP